MKRSILALAILVMLIPCQASVIIVDPNGFADYTTIQAAINASWDGDTVVVRPSTYNENILFNGRAITLTSDDPDDQSTVASTIITSASGATVNFNFGEDSNSVITGFTIIGQYAIDASTGLPTTPTISRNIITGTTYGILRCGGFIYNNIISGCNTGIDCREDAIISNNVIIWNTNRGILLTGSIIPPVLPVMTVKNNIIAYNNTGLYCAGDYAISDNSYNCFWNNNINFEGTAINGTGDFLRDPLFAGGSDYHLKSAAGRWTDAGWVLDDVNSPCIDRGDPCDPIGIEPNPNGGRINIGAYGGTAKASKSPSGIIEPVCFNPPSMDTNNDCKIDFVDFAKFVEQWLTCGLEPQEACWE